MNWRLNSPVRAGLNPLVTSEFSARLNSAVKSEFRCGLKSGVTCRFRARLNCSLKSGLKFRLIAQVMSAIPAHVLRRRLGKFLGRIRHLDADRWRRAGLGHVPLRVPGYGAATALTRDGTPLPAKRQGLPSEQNLDLPALVLRAGFDEVRTRGKQVPAVVSSVPGRAQPKR